MTPFPFSELVERVLSIEILRPFCKIGSIPFRYPILPRESLETGIFVARPAAERHRRGKRLLHRGPRAPPESAPFRSDCLLHKCVWTGFFLPAARSGDTTALNETFAIPKCFLGIVSGALGNEKSTLRNAQKLSLFEV